MRNKRSMPGWRSLASRYCCIIGVMGNCGLRIVDCGLLFESAIRNPQSAIVLFFGAVTNLAHTHRVAPRAESDLAHVVAHQHETPAAGTFEVLDGGGIGNILGVKALAFIGDEDFEALGGNTIGNADLLGAVHMVAMLDGVD